MHKVLVNRLGGLSLPRKSVVRLTDRPDMTLDVYRGRKTTIQYNSQDGRMRYMSSLGTLTGKNCFARGSKFRPINVPSQALGAYCSQWNVYYLIRSSVFHSSFKLYPSI